MEFAAWVSAHQDIASWMEGIQGAYWSQPVLVQEVVKDIAMVIKHLNL